MQAEILNYVEPACFTGQVGEEDFFSALRELIKKELTPKVVEIDLKGEYPEAFLRELGEMGGFAGAVLPEYGGSGEGVEQVIKVMEEVSKECMSTGFLVWAQTSCAWYLQNSRNKALAATMLPLIARGQILAGTGLSNPMKSCAAIEEVRLKASRTDGGYIVNGTLPWVSNIGPGHYFAIGAGVTTEPGLLVALVSCDMAGLTLNQNAHFVALEGSNTFACQFKDVFVADEMVIAHPAEFDQFVSRIKPGFVLSQMGMGLGLIDACAKMMQQSNKSLSHVNQYLDDQAEDIENALDSAREATYKLARELYLNPEPQHMRQVIEIRITGSELALKAANGAMLHMGAKGYLIRSPAQRRLREAYFVAIVTPALKHLKKELVDMSACACAA